MFAILAIVGIILIIDLFLLANDRYVWSFLVTAASIAFAYYTFPEVPAVIQSIGLSTILTWYLPMFVVLGIGVATVKWLLLVRNVADDIAAIRLGFPSSKEEDESDGQRRARFVNRVHERAQGYSNLSRIHNQLSRLSSGVAISEKEMLDHLTPQAKKEADRIAFWILQWPLVLLSTLIEDILLKLGKYVAQAFDAMFNRMSRGIISKAVTDI